MSKSTTTKQPFRQNEGVISSVPPASMPPSNEPDDVVKFVNLVMRGVQSWLDAGKLLLSMQRSDKNVFNKIIARCEWITVDTLMTFTRIGRMELRPEVLLLNANTGNKLMKLGYSGQCKLLDSRVPVVVDLQKDGQPLVQEKKATELTQNDLKTLISGSKLRTVHEQADAMRKRIRDKQALVIDPVVREAFNKPEKKLLFLGCYRIVMRSGVPSITKAATLPLNAQRVLLTSNMGDTDCFLELTKWSE